MAIVGGAEEDGVTTNFLSAQRRFEERALYKGSSAHKGQAESGNNRAHANIGKITGTRPEILPGCPRKVRGVNHG